MSCCFGLNLILNQTPNLSNYSKYAAITLTASDRTNNVILAKHSIELPGDGHLVIRNMLEQF